MKAGRKVLVVGFSSIICLAVWFMLAVSPVVAAEYLIWDQYVFGDGGAQVSPVLETNLTYRIVAEEIWYYDNASNLAADAQYYTTNFSNSWYWGDYFPAPGNHSFLQIDGGDVDWGPFSNGDTGHRYSINYTGEGVALTFNIVDWIDGDKLGNGCKIRVRIYEPVTVGGYVVEPGLSEAAKLPVVSLMAIALLMTAPLVRHRRRKT